MSSRPGGVCRDGAPRARRRGGDLGDGRRQHPRPAPSHRRHSNRRHGEGSCTRPYSNVFSVLLERARLTRVDCRGFCRRSSGTTWTARGRWVRGWDSTRRSVRCGARRRHRACRTPTSAATPSPAGPTSTTRTRPRCRRRSTASRSMATATSEVHPRPEFIFLACAHHVDVIYT
jgi:hypothetical protein